jgi:hypothetical protein
MTPEERAHGITKHLENPTVPGYTILMPVDVIRDAIAAMIADAERGAIAAERKAYAQLEDQRDELLGTMELAWELVDCVSIAAQEGDGAATVDVERARMRQAEILAQMDALLSKVKQYLAARSEATP